MGFALFSEPLFDTNKTKGSKNISWYPFTSSTPHFVTTAKKTIVKFDENRPGHSLEDLRYISICFCFHSNV